MTTVRRILKPSVLRNHKQLCELDLTQSGIFLSPLDADLGTTFMDKLEESRLAPDMKERISSRCMDFLKELVKQYQLRLPASMEILSKLELFCPKSVMSTINRPVVKDLPADLFSCPIGTLETQWRNVATANFSDDQDIDKFWLEVEAFKDAGGHKCFQELAQGAHAEDWVRWQGQLSTLYEALISEIGQIGSRGRYATGSRHIAVKENLIELTADVCHQLFGQGTHVQEVTSSLYRDTQRDSPQNCKHRRIEQPLTNWEVIRSKLQPNLSDFDMIPWLQVTAALISKYPSILPADELVPLLGLLCQLQGEQQRRGERTALLKHSIPNSVHSSDFTVGFHMETGGETPTLRDSILSWLLMNEQSEETEDN
ncbi:Serine-protein kinase ATM [Triplophysa tibetana]|uniref:Serine-protein kinase ATM n=1 Tax=Triplophysa tibetana TaxID=1572043 RepID=A0A5A9MY26_9TELE|nr:Serine-protein kinase ATM [Triplophysa tibetana]